MFIHLFSSIVTTVPALAFWMLITISAGQEYFWKVYFIVGGGFLAVSLVIGYLIPCSAREHWKRHPSWWILFQGLLAWFMAVVFLVVLNLTPLCIGQENGDGTNDVLLCVLESEMVSFVSLPLEFILIGLTAVTGGWLIRRLVK